MEDRGYHVESAWLKVLLFLCIYNQNYSELSNVPYLI